MLDGNRSWETSRIELLGSDIHHWRIIFADTALHANIRQRLLAMRRGRSWFSDDNFWALLRLRGVESGGPGRFAEAFRAPRKLVL